MKKFMDENFLLNTPVAQELYHNFAKEMPIYDYHCHLSPADISLNKSYKNITKLWLDGDHYKWRAMRANGIDENYITGDADDYEKFVAWAKTVSMCIGNPLFHWTHLELQRYFGIYDVLNPDTAQDIWDKCNKVISEKDFRVKKIIEKSNVKLICTTDDPIDTLEYHKKIREDSNFRTKVLPTFRPDRALNIEETDFMMWLKKLCIVSGVGVNSYSDYLRALDNRLIYFHQEGCRISDHSLEDVFYVDSDFNMVKKIFEKKLNGNSLTMDELKKFKTYTLNYLGKKYSEYGWVMQLHIGALRNNNSRMLGLLGKDTGFDSINDQSIAKPLSKILNSMDRENKLPKTILYCLNPKDNYVLGTMIGNFQTGGVPGKIQFGSGWWFNDQKDGIVAHMKALANLGLLSRFIGMLTDSRSFISYTRHEYFRRILCNLIGQWIMDGELPYDINYLGNIIKDICYNNAKDYFDIRL